MAPLCSETRGKCRLSARCGAFRATGDAGGAAGEGEVEVAVIRERSPGEGHCAEGVSCDRYWSQCELTVVITDVSKATLGAGAQGSAWLCSQAMHSPLHQ
ncbi:hypothetical protein AOLI_G00205950 [Acnodon oligacanthus]